VEIELKRILESRGYATFHIYGNGANLNAFLPTRRNLAIGGAIKRRVILGVWYRGGAKFRGLRINGPNSRRQKEKEKQPGFLSPV